MQFLVVGGDGNKNEYRLFKKTNQIAIGVKLQMACHFFMPTSEFF